MSGATFARQLTVEASTKRPPAPASGKRGSMVVHLALVMIAPLTNVTLEVAQRAGLETPHTLLQTFADSDADIAEGDELTPESGPYADKAMPVRRVVRLPWGVRGASERLHILLENLRR